MNQSQVNRNHTIITAPIDGIVTQRSVDVGQTVAASMSAPTLFVIAADLTEMQVNANIDEADVGRIRPGQHVTFRVDAYPTDNFDGTVTQIRLQPVVVQNVTTYGTVITVPNKQLKLKPGMTANVKIEIAKRTGTLRIANAALRFRPTNEMFAAFKQEPPPDAAAFGGAGRGGAAGRECGAAQARRHARPRQRTAPRAAPRNGCTAAHAAATAPAAQAAPDAPAIPPPPGGFGRGDGGGGRGGSGGGGRDGAGGGGRGGPEFQARMLERFKTMPPEEQAQFIARMKERGGDTSAFEALMAPAGRAPAGPAARAPRAAATPQAQTIDALFAPLPPVQSRGRAWVFVDGTAEGSQPPARHQRRHEHGAVE